MRKLSANKELYNCVSNVVYRQTNKMGRFDLGRFDFGTFWLRTFWLGTFSLGTFWLWDILTLGRFDLGRFYFGTFWLGTFWLWDVLTWDDLTLGHFDQCVHKKCLLSRVWLNIVKIYLGRFDSPKMGRFGKSLGTFWFWDVLTGYPSFVLRCHWDCTASLQRSTWSAFRASIRYVCFVQPLNSRGGSVLKIGLRDLLTTLIVFSASSDRSQRLHCALVKNV